jgi:predicted cytidylate kinase
MTTITISGPPGSGTTTVATLLQKRTGLPYVYAGDIFRSMAQQHHMSLEEFGRYCELHQELDQQLDRNQLGLLKKGNIILEGRISGWIAYRNKISSVKIYLEASLKTRVLRIVKREEGKYLKRKQEIQQRERSEATRYQKYYNIDIKDTSIYDLVIDTAKKTPEEIVNLIVETLE